MGHTTYVLVFFFILQEILFEKGKMLDTCRQQIKGMKCSIFFNPSDAHRNFIVDACIQ